MRNLSIFHKELNETKVARSVLNWFFNCLVFTSFFMCLFCVCMCVHAYLCDLCLDSLNLFLCIPNSQWRMIWKIKVVDRNLLMSNGFWGMNLVILVLYNSMFTCLLFLLCFLFQNFWDEGEKKANLQSKGVDNTSGANCIEGWRYKFSLRFSMPIKSIFHFDYGLEQVATFFSIKSCFLLIK